MVSTAFVSRCTIDVVAPKAQPRSSATRTVRPKIPLASRKRRELVGAYNVASEARRRAAVALSPKVYRLPSPLTRTPLPDRAAARQGKCATASRLMPHPISPRGFRAKSAYGPPFRSHASWRHLGLRVATARIVLNFLPRSKGSKPTTAKEKTLLWICNA